MKVNKDDVLIRDFSEIKDTAKFIQGIFSYGKSNECTDIDDHNALLCALLYEIHKDLKKIANKLN